MHFLVGRCDFDNFFEEKIALPQRKSRLEEGDCIYAIEYFFFRALYQCLQRTF